MATETLGGVYPKTEALYWVEAELKAPVVEGDYTWEAKFPKPDLELSHEGASCTFGFITSRPPEHMVTVEVIDKKTKTPIKDAYVLLNSYRAYTDEGGVVKMGVPKGEHELYVSKVAYKESKTTVKVASDITIKAELEGT